MSNIFDSDNGDGTDITNGTQIVQVKDKRLAAALIAVGIPLRKDPPYIQVRKKDGKRITIFHFEPYDPAREFKTTELIKAWSQDLEWIENNTLHPFTFAMVALRNYQDVLEHLKNDTPYVAFEGYKNGRKAVTLVKEGSKKHAAAAKRSNLKQL